MVRDKVEEAEWKYLDVNEHWQRIKKYNAEKQHSSHVDCQKVHADIRKRGGRMRSLPKQ